MKCSRSVAALVIASFLVGAVPKVAADEAPINLRAAIDRAAAQLDPQPAAAKSKGQRSTSKAVQPGFGGGGGGGKGRMVVSLVTTVVGLAATYYLLKQMQEQAKQTGQ